MVVPQPDEIRSGAGLAIKLGHRKATARHHGIHHHQFLEKLIGCQVETDKEYAVQFAPRLHGVCKLRHGTQVRG
jgi:hypothetical protein